MNEIDYFRPYRVVAELCGFSYRPLLLFTASECLLKSDWGCTAVSSSEQVNLFRIAVENMELIFSQALAHGKSKIEIRKETDEEGKKRRTNMVPRLRRPKTFQRHFVTSCRRHVGQSNMGSKKNFIR